MPSSPQPPVTTPSSNNQHPIAQQLAVLQAAKQQAISSPQTPPPSPPTWTGFQGKTTWDWLDFLVKVLGALAIPLVVFWASSTFTDHQQQAANVQHRNELTIADNQQKETILKTYLDDMNDLMLNRGLRTSKVGDIVRVVALTETLSALRQLTSKQNSILLRFLWDAHILGAQYNNAGELLYKYTFLNFERADLSNDNMDEGNWYGTYMGDAHLDHAHLRNAILNYASLSNANASGADLRGAHLVHANLNNTDLSGANLSGTNLYKTYLKGANLYGAVLTGTTYLTQKQLDQAKTCRDTITPRGITHSQKQCPTPSNT